MVQFSHDHAGGCKGASTKILRFIRSTLRGGIIALIPLLLVSLVIMHRHQEISSGMSIRPGGDRARKKFGLTKNVHPKKYNNSYAEKTRLNFIVAGFPKCGTTTLLHSFLKHNETAIAPREFCAMNGPGDSKARVAKLNDVLHEMKNPSDELPVKRGIKCPMSIWDSRGIQLISANFKYTKIIVGVRHPVDFFQSFYNYRITEMYNNGEAIVTVPSPLELIGSTKWRDVSTDLARFELSLMQLGKTSLSPIELNDLASHGKRLSPTRYKIFLYSIEQLSDEDKNRAAQFRADLQKFLRLESPLEPFPKENTNPVRRSESIDICDDKFNQLRFVLTKQGDSTFRWIRDRFMQSDDVFVGGKAYFLSLIEKWGDDPCLVESGRKD